MRTGSVQAGPGIAPAAAYASKLTVYLFYRVVLAQPTQWAEVRRGCNTKDGLTGDPRSRREVDCVFV
jgi:hypothetical protein